MRVRSAGIRCEGLSVAMQDAIAASRDMLKRCDAVREAQSGAAGAAAIVQPDSDAWCAVLCLPPVVLEGAGSHREGEAPLPGAGNDHRMGAGMWQQPPAVVLLAALDQMFHGRGCNLVDAASFVDVEDHNTCGGIAGGWTMRRGRRLRRWALGTRRSPSPCGRRRRCASPASRRAPLAAALGVFYVDRKRCRVINIRGHDSI